MSLTSANGPEPWLTVGNLLRSRERLTPDREALLAVDTGQRYSYRDLNRRANRCANFCRDTLDVRLGDRVSILAHNSVVYLDLYFGLAKLGAIFTPLNWRLAAPELTYIMSHCRPSVLLVGPEFVDVVEELRSLLTDTRLVALDGASVEGAISYDDALAAASYDEIADVRLNGDTPHCILYTSGTTGRPKGAVIPHRQIVWNAINTVISWGLTEHDVSPVFTPMFHAGGLFAFLTPLFYAGGRILLSRGFDAERTLRDIVEEQCTVVLGVPTLFRMWREAPAYESADFGRVRFFISGGAPCPPDLIERWRKEKQIVFRQGYGLTEAGPNCFSMTDEESVLKTGSVGKPVIHSEMRLVDKHGQDVAAGEVGELLIRGPHVFSNYWEDAEATAETLRDGWLHTGDMARRDEDGFYTINGRFKDMIISGGENVYAAEVEAIYQQHPAVAEAALIGQPDEKWGEVGLIFVVLEPGQTVAQEALADFARRHLAAYKVPRHVEIVEALPYSPYGKVIKAELRERFLNEAAKSFAQQE